MRLFLLISLYKNNFLPSCCRTLKKILSLHWRDADFAHGIVLIILLSFYDIMMTYIFQLLESDIRVQQLCLWKHMFLRKMKFSSGNFQNSASIIKKSFFKNVIKNPYLVILILKLEGLKFNPLNTSVALI